MKKKILSRKEFLKLTGVATAGAVFGACAPAAVPAAVPAAAVEVPAATSAPAATSVPEATAVQPTAVPEPVAVRLTIPADPGNVDPTAEWVYEVGSHQWVTLVNYDYAKNEAIPAGAVSWSVSADNLTWTFNIRKDWKWSDGQPVTAKDYEYAFQETVNPATASPTAWRLSIIKNADDVNKGEKPATDMGVKALDDHTLTIELAKPASWFLSSLSSIGHAVPRWTREKFGADWTKPENVVVNGPYKVTEWVTDSEVTLSKNPSYYDAATVQIDKVSLFVVNSESTAMAMYENGEIDTVMVPSTDIDRVRQVNSLKDQFATAPKMVVQFYRFYAEKPPFDNVLVRKAFAAAVDRDTLVSKITRGNEVPAYTFTPPGCVGHVPGSDGVGIPFDPKVAAQYLADGGYPGGKGLPALVLGYNANETNARVAQAIQKMWKDHLSVEVTLKAHEGKGYGDAATSGDMNIVRAGWGMDYPDANNTYGELFDSNVSVKGVLKLPEVDELIAEAAVETDLDKRKSLYKQIETTYIQDNAGVIPLYWATFNSVTKPFLNRLPYEPSFLMEFWKWTVNNN